MPSPTTSVNVDNLRPDLGSFLEFDLEMNRRKFIGARVLPLMDVSLAADVIGKIPIEQLLKRADARRTSSGGYNRLDWSFAKDSYACEEYGLEGVIDQRNARKYQNYFDAELATSRLVMHQVALEAEIRVASAIFNATTFSATTITNEWDDADNATPITDVEASVNRVHDATGIWPNALIINLKVFRNLRLCDQILDRIAASGAGDRIRAQDVTESMLQALFDLDHIIVAGGDYNSADEGQTASIAPIWSNEYAMVAKVADTNDIAEPALGRTFHWTADGSQQGGTVESYYSDETRSDVVRVRHDVDEKLLYVECADLMDNITT